MGPFQVNALRNFYTKLRGGDERALTRRMLDQLGETLQCHLPDLERIPKTGAAVIVCNHLYGMLEGNKLLAEITELDNICIWVNPIADRGQAARFNSQGPRECLAWRKKGGLLVMFPAGEVSTIDFRRRGIVDPAWIPSATWLARKCGEVKVPFYFSANNSVNFYLLGLVDAKLLTAALPAELVDRCRRRRWIVLVTTGRRRTTCGPGRIF